MKNIPNLTFQKFVESAKVLKDNYECLLVPFFHSKAIRCWKIMIYSLDIPEWKRDRIWNYLNNDIEYEDLAKLMDTK